MGDLLRTIDPDRCIANQRRREKSPAELSGKAILLALFLLELVLLIARMLWARRNKTIVFTRDVLISRLLPLVMMTTSLIITHELLASALSRAVGSRNAGILLLCMLGAAWLIRAAIRLNKGIDGVITAYRASRRILQSLALLLGVVLTLIALDRLISIFTEIDLNDGVGINDATRAMFMLVSALVVAFYAASLARADHTHNHVVAPDAPPELPKALRLLRERELQRAHEAAAGLAESLAKDRAEATSQSSSNTEASDDKDATKNTDYGEEA